MPQIAARPEIYNEAGLWPLIYRANRDQVRDPYQLWPGQVLKIPRSYSREEAVEADVGRLTDAEGNHWEARGFVLIFVEEYNGFSLTAHTLLHTVYRIL